MKRNCFLIILLAAMTVTASCNRAPFRVEAVEGIVTMGGQPLGDAVLTFVPVDPEIGKAAYARTDESGFYRLTAMNGGKSGAGTKTGDYRVSVVKNIPLRTPREGEVDVPMKAGIPEKYMNAETSGLSAMVVKGKNRFDFELK